MPYKFQNHFMTPNNINFLNKKGKLAPIVWQQIFDYCCISSRKLYTYNQKNYQHGTSWRDSESKALMKEVKKNVSYYWNYLCRNISNTSVNAWWLRGRSFAWLINFYATLIFNSEFVWSISIEELMWAVLFFFRGNLHVAPCPE